jgi:hypothetical protein
MKITPTVRLLAFICILIPLAPVATARPPRAETEHGTFRLHKFMQAIGSETYSVERDGDALALSSSFEFTDRGTKVPLATNLRMAADLTPRSTRPWRSPPAGPP